jgi:ABC-type polysaccharide/polyol phosphate transport system ATPase subunit
VASIRATALSLTLPIYRQRSELAATWAGTIAGAAFKRPVREYTTILSDVSFDVAEGDRIALLGRNGSGKSTLLHLLTGAYRPTSGSLQVEGSRQALMNISLGFNPDATVLENIYLRATAMGIRIQAIQPHIAAILDFAGIGEKAVDRLRTLSAGQRMRLGFAISTALQHDIMLLDEWIGTGDAEFLEKARTRMKSRVDGSKIVVVASHSLKLIRRLCNRALLLDGGRLVADGAAPHVIAEYHALIRERRSATAA